ncbi:uncharacterized protein LOC131432019 [Malaya genurostris]|uniref:uncharacterized protein LOC131432019 n=1 Tax=Malaya genurostris TaxID=325434 RepID=UPI0026F3A3C1|nr:uncharacterized protein LOC131432019 [Malaya genurostris]
MVTMATIRSLLVLISLVGFVCGDPFFGNNYQIPQSSELVRSANLVVTNLNAARNAVSSYGRNPPAASVSLNRGARVLADYVGNVSQLIGNVYSQLSRAATDRTTDPAVVFSKISTQINALRPLLQNSSVYVESLAAYFDYEGDNSTSCFFTEQNNGMKIDIEKLSTILQNVSRVVDSIAGQSLNTQQFIAVLSVNGLLQNLVDATQRAAIASNEYMGIITRYVAAINDANSVRLTVNSRLQTSRNAINSAVNSYISSSNSSFNSILSSTDSLFNHLKTLNESFVFRWPLLLSDRVESKLALLNSSIENLITNLHFRRSVVDNHYSLTGAIFRTSNEALAYLEEEAELLTRVLANAVNPNSCASNFRNQFYNLPGSVQSLLSQCFTSQLNLERQGANQVQSIANNFLRSYVTVVYANAEICFSHPFDQMSKCLDDFVDTIDFGGKFFLLETTTFYLFEQVQSELTNCSSRLVSYIRNVGLRANCQRNP